MELWDAYNADGTLAGVDLIRGDDVPEQYFHLVCEAVIQHTDGEYLLMQRSFNKYYNPGKWEIGASGAALKGENKVQAILREIKEETGIDCGNLKELYHVVHENHKAIYCGFLLVTSFDKKNIQFQEGETIGFKWVSKEELIRFYDSSECSPFAKDRVKDYIDSIR